MITIHQDPLQDSGTVRSHGLQKGLEGHHYQNLKLLRREYSASTYQLVGRTELLSLRPREKKRTRFVM